uniref:Chromatin modification-related protein MEAF6 n=1 Tax=Aureoumbra lagunensis TaxID=44058 RepID=A0A7S3NL07_9STRA|mmetsp:Transcript_11914/g.16135  ORF Transcript_11914/g.16135 Transcript_11914/m.16135 type:complete len:163 (+) Transcript_11914:77-565(+)
MAATPGTLPAPLSNNGEVVGEMNLSPRSQERQLANKIEDECNQVLIAIQKNIYSREGEYLEKTPHGNVIKGWDGFLDTRTGSLQKRRFDDRDRLFSYSDWAFTEANPQMFQNSRDDDPDNWTIALRKRAFTVRQQNVQHLSAGGMKASGISDRGGYRKKRKS